MPAVKLTEALKSKGITKTSKLSTVMMDVVMFHVLFMSTSAVDRQALYQRKMGDFTGLFEAGMDGTPFCQGLKEQLQRLGSEVREQVESDKDAAPVLLDVLNACALLAEKIAKKTKAQKLTRALVEGEMAEAQVDLVKPVYQLQQSDSDTVSFASVCYTERFAHKLPLRGTLFCFSGGNCIILAPQFVQLFDAAKMRLPALSPVQLINTAQPAVVKRDGQRIVFHVMTAANGQQQVVAQGKSSIRFVIEYGEGASLDEKLEQLCGEFKKAFNLGPDVSVDGLRSICRHLLQKDSTAQPLQLPCEYMGNMVLPAGRLSGHGLVPHSVADAEEIIASIKGEDDGCKADRDFLQAQVTADQRLQAEQIPGFWQRLFENVEIVVPEAWNTQCSVGGILTLLHRLLQIQKLQKNVACRGVAIASMVFGITDAESKKSLKELKVTLGKADKAFFDLLYQSRCHVNFQLAIDALAFRYAVSPGQRLPEGFIVDGSTKLKPEIWSAMMDIFNGVQSSRTVRQVKKGGGFKEKSKKGKREFGGLYTVDNSDEGRDHSHQAIQEYLHSVAKMMHELKLGGGASVDAAQSDLNNRVAETLREFFSVGLDLSFPADMQPDSLPTYSEIINLLKKAISENDAWVKALNSCSHFVSETVLLHLEETGKAAGWNKSAVLTIVTDEEKRDQLQEAGYAVLFIPSATSSGRIVENNCLDRLFRSAVLELAMGQFGIKGILSYGFYPRAVAEAAICVVKLVGNGANLAELDSVLLQLNASLSPAGGGGGGAKSDEKAIDLTTESVLNAHRVEAINAGKFLKALGTNAYPACVALVTMHLAALMTPILERTTHINSIRDAFSTQMQNLLDALFDGTPGLSFEEKVLRLKDVINIIGLAADKLAGRQVAAVDVDGVRNALDSVEIRGTTGNCYRFTYAQNVLTISYRPLHADKLCRGTIITFMKGGAKATLVASNLADMSDSGKFRCTPIVSWNDTSVVPKWDGNMLRFIVHENMLVVMGKKTPLLTVDLSKDVPVADIAHDIKNALRLAHNTPIIGLEQVLSYVIGKQESVECELMFNEPMGQGFQSDCARLLVPHQRQICDKLYDDVSKAEPESPFVVGLRKVITIHNNWNGSGCLTEKQGLGLWGAFIAGALGISIASTPSVGKDSIPLLGQLVVKDILLSLQFLKQAASFSNHIDRARVLAQVLFLNCEDLGLTDVKKEADIAISVKKKFGEEAKKLYMAMKAAIGGKEAWNAVCEKFMTALLFAYANPTEGISPGFNPSQSMPEGVIVTAGGYRMRLKSRLWSLLLKNVFNSDIAYSSERRPEERKGAIKELLQEAANAKIAISEIFLLLDLDPEGVFSGSEAIIDLMNRLFKHVGVNLAEREPGVSGATLFPDFDSVKNAFLTALPDIETAKLKNKDCKLVLTSAVLALKFQTEIEGLLSRYGLKKENAVVFASTEEKKQHLLDAGWPGDSIVELSQIYLRPDVEIPACLNNWFPGMALSAILDNKAWIRTDGTPLPHIISGTEVNVPNTVQNDCIGGRQKQTSAGFVESVQSGFDRQGIKPVVTGPNVVGQGLEKALAHIKGMKPEARVAAIDASLKAICWSTFFEVTCAVVSGHNIALMIIILSRTRIAPILESEENATISQLLGCLGSKESNDYFQLVNLFVEALENAQVPKYILAGDGVKKEIEVGVTDGKPKLRSLRRYEKLVALFGFVTELKKLNSDISHDMIDRVVNDHQLFLVENMESLIRYCLQTQAEKENKELVYTYNIDLETGDISYFRKDKDTDLETIDPKGIRNREDQVKKLIAVIAQLVVSMCSAGEGDAKVCLIQKLESIKAQVQVAIDLAAKHGDRLQPPGIYNHELVDTVIGVFCSMLDSCVDESDYAYVIQHFGPYVQPLMSRLLSRERKGMLQYAGHDCVRQFISDSLANVDLSALFEFIPPLLKPMSPLLGGQKEGDGSFYLEYVRLVATKLGASAFDEDLDKRKKGQVTNALIQLPKLALSSTDNDRYLNLCKVIADELQRLVNENEVEQCRFLCQAVRIMIKKFYDPNTRREVKGTDKEALLTDALSAFGELADKLGLSLEAPAAQPKQKKQKKQEKKKKKPTQKKPADTGGAQQVVRPNLRQVSYFGAFIKPADLKSALENPGAKLPASLAKKPDVPHITVLFKPNGMGKDGREQFLADNVYAHEGKTLQLKVTGMLHNEHFQLLIVDVGGSEFSPFFDLKYNEDKVPHVTVSHAAGVKASAGNELAGNPEHGTLVEFPNPVMLPVTIGYSPRNHQTRQQEVFQNFDRNNPQPFLAGSPSGQVVAGGGGGAGKGPAHKMDGKYRYKSTVVVLDDRGRVLLGSKNNAKPNWQLPGGGVHEGESRVDAALRELKEETGLGADHVATLGVESTLSHRYAIPNPTEDFEGQIEEVVYVQLNPGVNPDSVLDLEREDDEFKTLRWVPIDELVKESEPNRKAWYGKIVPELVEKAAPLCRKPAASVSAASFLAQKKDKQGGGAPVPAHSPT